MLSTFQLQQKLCVNAVHAYSQSLIIQQSNAVLMTFFLMMVVHQGVQEKARAEIDAVVGKDRLPTIDDRPSLPFLDAIFREMLRYNIIAPLCG